MLIRIIGCFLAYHLVCYSGLQAAAIATFDFSDAATWQVTLESSGDANNLGSASGDSISIDKSSGSGGARITVDLIGSISTIGFEDIVLEFTGLTSGQNWNGNLSNPVASSDGLLIVGSGISVNANSSNDISGTAAETDFLSGASFPNANFAGSALADFTFEDTFDDSTISDLTFVLQINSNSEELTLSGVGISGTAIAIPEPGTVSSLALVASSTVLMRRHRSRPRIRKI
ncbi:PEP-CTERM sorting domain-containing protein [Rhodopirellula europaea]|uniref:PEP-CTERM sorting domain-containing protein n=1 Tax=Rhodopirellula europaea TaxID=1263866 RepID=UPI000586B42D|nr:PEP-CTERM sorting domain-containing protein [Rhodopirellula europaea]